MSLILLVIKKREHFYHATYAWGQNAEHISIFAWIYCTFKYNVLRYVSVGLFASFKVTLSFCKGKCYVKGKGAA